MSTDAESAEELSKPLSEIIAPQLISKVKALRPLGAYVNLAIEKSEGDLDDLAYSLDEFLSRRAQEKLKAMAKRNGESVKDIVNKLLAWLLYYEHF